MRKSKDALAFTALAKGYEAYRQIDFPITQKPNKEKYIFALNQVKEPAFIKNDDLPEAPLPPIEIVFERRRLAYKDEWETLVEAILYNEMVWAKYLEHLQRQLDQAKDLKLY